MAAELMERFLAKVGVASWEASVEKGEWSALLESMRAWVHGAAGLEDSPTTILKALGGETLKVDAFVRYLDRKYLA
jgi:Zn-dependent M32 family carboxypeptidase